MENIKIYIKAENSEDIIIRVASAFHKKGFLIKGFMLGETETDDGVEMVVTAEGMAEKTGLMIRYLNKLCDIKQAGLAA